MLCIVLLSSDGNGPVRRYCPCCYCELFGQNAVSKYNVN